MRILGIGVSGHLGKRFILNLAESSAEIDLNILRTTSRESAHASDALKNYETLNISQTYLSDALRDGFDLKFDSAFFIGSAIPKNRFELQNFDVNSSLQPAVSVRKMIEEGKLEVGNIVYVSSAAVYGNCGQFSINSPLNPVDAYGVYKLRSEQLFSSLCLEREIPLDIVRPTLIFGPSESLKRMTTALVRHVLELQDIHFDGCEGLRNYVYVDDVARYLALLCSKFRTKNIVRYHNLGNESVFQIGDFVKMTLSVAGNLNWFQGAYPSKLVLSSTSSTDFTLQHHYDLEQDFRQEPPLTTIEKYLLWAQANENKL